MAEFPKKYALALIALLLATQFLVGLWRISDPFIDGRYHYNWAPPFWLLKAKETNDVGIIKSVFGIVSGHTENDQGEIEKINYYSSHPQLIGPSFALWTKVFGYSERSSRIFTLALTIAATALFIFALRKLLGTAFAILFGALFASLPLIYIYGKRIDFENLVLVGLAAAFLGYAKLVRKERYALPIFYLGLIVLTLSDWSGFVLVFMIGLAALFFIGEYHEFAPLDHKSLGLQVEDEGRVSQKINKNPVLQSGDLTGFAKKVLLSAGISLIAGIILFTLQNYLQSGYASAGDFLERYKELALYRSNIDTGNITWPLWALKQWVHIRMNFGAFLWIIAIASIFSAAFLAVKKSKTMPIEERAAIFFAVAVFLGGGLWIALIKQGSFVHLSYQYFFSLPVAFGIIWFIQRLTQSIKKINFPRYQTFIGLGILLIIFSIWHSYSTYAALLTRDFNGDKTDVELIKNLRGLPEEAKIIAVGDVNEVEWWATPNIEYYAGRLVQTYTFQKVPLAPYQIVPARLAEQIKKLISDGSSYGTPMPASIKECSTNFCLLEVKGIKKT